MKILFSLLLFVGALTQHSQPCFAEIPDQYGVTGLQGLESVNLTSLKVVVKAEESNGYSHEVFIYGTTEFSACTAPEPDGIKIIRTDTAFDNQPDVLKLVALYKPFRRCFDGDPITRTIDFSHNVEYSTRIRFGYPTRSIPSAIVINGVSWNSSNAVFIIEAPQ